MPSVPSTCVPVDALDSVVLPDNGLLSVDELTGSPTPDPDTDDVVLVQPDNGMVLQGYPSQCPPQTIAKPRSIELGELTLHSPSSFVGTPFDSSPRFEYPFPPGLPGDVNKGMDPGVPSFHLSASSHSAFPSATPSLPGSGPPSLPFPSTVGPPARARVEPRCLSPTHPTHIKLNVREPPMPPGLKRKMDKGDSTMVSVKGFDIVSPTSANQPTRTRRRSGSLSGLSEKLELLSRTPAKEATIGEKLHQAHLADNKWKRHSLAICERDREVPADGAKGDLDHEILVEVPRGELGGVARIPIPRRPSSTSFS